MTKMKSKKMTKSTFAIIVMAIALVALLAFGGTYAYFTATATTSGDNKFTTGIISIKDNTITTLTTKKAVPGEQVAAGVTVKNESNRAAYIFVKIKGTYSKGTTKNAALPADALNLTPITTGADKWTPMEAPNAGIYYRKTADGVTADPIKICNAITFNPNVNVHYNNGAFDNKEGTVDLMGAEITITIETHAVQAIKDGETEFSETEAFGKVTFAS